MDSYIKGRLIGLLAMMKASDDHAESYTNAHHALNYRRHSSLMAISILTDIISTAEKREAVEAEASQ